MIATFAVMKIYHFMLVFARIGSAFMLLPGIGEVYVSVRSRLAIALLISYLLLPILSLPAFPKHGGNIVFLLASEITIGLFFGLFARILINIMHIIGMVVATQSGLSSATLFDPTQGTQGAIVGNFLTVLAVTLLLALELHYPLLLTLARSYELFPVGNWPVMGDIAEVFVKTVSHGFYIAIHFTASQLVLSLILFIGMGVLARLMPAVQIFFIVAPLQIILSLGLLMLTLSVTMLWYMDYVADALKSWPFF